MWFFPLKIFKYKVPSDSLLDLGAFSFVRKHDIHTGVDLYCNHGDDVYSVEDGVVIGIIPFTGITANSPWWNDTKAILIKGNSGIVVYGEVEPIVKEGNAICRGEKIGKVCQVLKKDKNKTPLAMLHIELYKEEIIDTVIWELNTNKPINLLDPTLYLLESYDFSKFNKD